MNIQGAALLKVAGEVGRRAVPQPDLSSTRQTILHTTPKRGLRSICQPIPFATHQPRHPATRHPATRHPDAGFTLIESLVALVVLAVTSVALLSATQAHIARIGGLETRAAAGWVTENYLAELTLGLKPSQTPPKMLGIGFGVTEQRAATQDPALSEVILTAAETKADGAAGQPFGRLTGFVDIGLPAVKAAP